jgi:hypothetical protein
VKISRIKSKPVFGAIKTIIFSNSNVERENVPNEQMTAIEARMENK